MAFSILTNKKMNLLIASASEPAITDGIMGATGESGIMIWCNRSVNVLARLTGATEWTVIGSLSATNTTVNMYWEDYVGINFQSQTGKSEKVRLFPRHAAVATSDISSGSDNYAIDKLDEFSDLPPPLGADTGKFLSVAADGSLEFITNNEGSGATALKQILSVSAVSTPLLAAGAEATLEITGKGFKPKTRVYMFAGSPTPTQILNYYNHTAAIMGNIMNDGNAVEKLSDDTTTETGKINVFYNGSDYNENEESPSAAANWIKPYGYKNPNTISLRISPDVAHISNVYSLILVNPDGKKSVLENCLTVSA
tara:strand:+ start:8619 stop:9551 length:933 start_codon:yes stop_codon:yes gene_type:complete